MVVALVGAALMLVALLVPSAALIEALRAPAPALAPRLLAGASMFRGSVALLGAFLVTGGYLGWWRGRGVAASRPSVSGAELALASALLAAGAGLRLYGLNQGLWVDGVGYALLDYVRPPVGEIVTTYGSQNQHFLFSVLAHLSMAAFGESAWSLRLTPAIFGIATLWAFWRLALRLTTPAEAMLGMAMLTFSYQHIWFSQNARGYSALLFWTIVSSHCLIRALRERSPRLWAWYAVTTALGMYTHMTMGFVVMGQCAVYGWDAVSQSGQSWGRRVTPLFSGFVLAGILTVVCYAIVLPQIPDAAAGDLSNVAEWRSPIWMLAEIGRGLTLGPALVLAAALGAVVFGAGFVSYWRESPVLPVLFTLPTVLGGATMMALGHHLWPRFFFFAVGFGVLIIVRGLGVVVRAGAGWLRLPFDRRLAVQGVTVLVIALLARSIPYVYRPKQDYVGARDFVESARQAGDAVVAVGVAAAPFSKYFAPGWSTASTFSELEAIRARSTRTWLVYTLPIEMQNTYPEIFASARREYQLIRTFDGSLGDGTIYVLRSDRARPVARQSLPQVGSHPGAALVGGG